MKKILIVGSGGNINEMAKQLAQIKASRQIVLIVADSPPSIMKARDPLKFIK